MFKDIENNTIEEVLDEVGLLGTKCNLHKRH